METALGHAARAEATHNKVGGLTDEQRFWMHYIRADIASYAGTAAQLLFHARLVVALLPDDVPAMNRNSAHYYVALGLKAANRDMEADVVATALAQSMEAEGAPDGDLHAILLVQEELAARRGETEAAIALRVRCSRLMHQAGDPGRVVSGLVTLAGHQLRLNRQADAVQTFEAAETFVATSFPTPLKCESNVTYVRDQRKKALA